MDLLTIDYETFYDDDYTLKKMTTEAYVRDPRFEMILVSVKVNAIPAFWIFRDRFEHFIENEVDWANTACIAQHAHFDGFILSHHFNKRPAMWIDTLSMARVIRGAKARNGLEFMLQDYGLKEKGDYVKYAKGKHLADFTGGEIQAYGSYSCGDSDGTYDLAQIFLQQLPMDELRLIDLNTRMFTEPVFVGDQAKLQQAITVERERRIVLLRKIGLLCPDCVGAGQLPDLLAAGLVACKKCKGTGVDKKPIGSSDKFAAMLRKFGVEPEMKPSPKVPGKMIYAFAKTDPAMQELLEDSDEDIRQLAEARIAVKSNIIESRAQRFLACAQRGPMPVYSTHAGAHTLRPSGGDSLNFLNMSNHNDNRPEMAVLKQSIQAPPGYVIVAADSGQGEARILARLANQLDLLEAFAQGRDVYSEHAATVYNRPVDRKKIKADFIPGQVGKTSILGLGFGMGWYKYAMELLKGMLGNPPIQFVISDMEALGIDPSPFLNSPKKVQMVSQMPSRLELNDLFIHCIVVEAIVKRYRAKYQNIAGKAVQTKNAAGYSELDHDKSGFWQICEAAINAMIEGREMVFGAHGIFRTAKDRVYTPRGLWLDYHDIHRREDGEVTYFNGRGRTKIYGSLFTENLVQHLHRTVVAGQMLEISTRYKVALWPYDEVVAIAPEAEAEATLKFMLETMARTPGDLPGLPLASEGGYGPTYAEAK